MKNKYWRTFPTDSSHQVVAHAKFRMSRGKRPAMGFMDLTNPRQALALAQQWVVEAAEAAEKQRASLNSLGTLTPAEVDELVRFDYYLGPETVEDQVRRYYLYMKRDAPARAEDLLHATNEILGKPRDLEVVRDLCYVLWRFLSGSLIRYEGKTYCVENHSFRKI